MFVRYRLFLLLSSISVLQAQLIVTTIVGGAIRSGVPAENVQLNGTAGITHDPAGNLVFCEHHVIRRLNPDGTIQTLAGTGTSGFSGDGGPAVQAQLKYPESPQYDSKGNLYFIDENTRIRRVDTSGVITTVAGTGIYGSIGAGGPAVTAQIAADSLVIAPDDSLYFAESTDIRRLTTAGNIELVAGGPNPQCVGGPEGNGQLCNAHSLAMDNSGDLYFVEDISPGVPNNGEVRSYIYRVSSTGAVTPFAGFGNPASGLPAGGPAMQAAFLAISAIVLDSSANMYVASSVDVSQLLNFYPSIQRVSEIDRISSADGTVKTVAGQATSPSPYEGPALQAYLGIVSGFVLNNDGSVAFSSINTIGELTTQSTVQLLAGRTIQLPPDGQPAAGLSWLSLPVSVQMAASRSGNFYFSDHCTIRKVGANGLLATVAGTGNCASSVPKTFGPSVDLPPIYSLAADSHDNIFVGMGSGLYSLGAAGVVSAIGGISYPDALAVDSLDRVYVVSFENGLYRVAPDQTVTSLRWNPLPIGFQWSISPGISIDSSDNVYLLNQYSYGSSIDNVVYRFTPDGMGNPVATLQLANPGFAVDALGSVWYVELFNLEHVEPSSVPIVMNKACCGYSGDGGAVVGAQFQPYPGATLTNDASGNIYVLDTGNAAIRKITGTPPAKAPVISSGGIVNAASLLGGAIAPGELISIFGSNFLSSGLQLNAAENNVIPATLSNLRVGFNGNGIGANGVITAATPNQINVFVPYEIAGSTSVTISVSADYVGSSSVTVPVAQSAFGLSTADASGSGQGAILNQDGSYNSDSNPALAGSVVSLFGTGEGLTTPALPDGALVISTPYSIPNQTVTVTIGGQPAQVLYAGAAPFLPTGVLQINAQIPAGVTGDAPVLVSIGGISTSRMVTVAVK
jgi:uncharacterized protein (TIGR03437 family)